MSKYFDVPKLHFKGMYCVHADSIDINLVIE